MTTLNTIIEEEKRKLFDHIEKLEHGIQQWNGLNVWEAGEMDDHADLIEFAIQRAYEAGEREADAKWEREVEGMKENEQLMYDTEDDVEYRTYRAGKAPDLLHKDIQGIAEKVKLTTLNTLLSKIRS